MPPRFSSLFLKLHSFNYDFFTHSYSAFYKALMIGHYIESYLYNIEERDSENDLEKDLEKDLFCSTL